ncbi:MAG: PIN domain nuclease [Candidatus Atribacteria bacterium]|nr:PIN domain nuclease [Candidatus Atribacteria bacterium]MCK4308606.1 PIN domain nuclease [Candidatus Atribacteria bacterium]
MPAKRILRIIFIIVGAVIGYEAYRRFYFISDSSIYYNILFNFLAIVIGGTVGFLLSFLFNTKIQRLCSEIICRLQKIPTQNIAAAIIGLIIGLIIANLLAYSLSFIPLIGSYLPIVLSVIMGLIGINIGLNKKDEIINFFGSFKGFNRIRKKEYNKYLVHPKILDTSVIIDGRILDICQTDFLEGDLIIPRFVLSELQHIADSSDSLKRNRGRRGLDILNKMIKIKKNKIKIIGKDYKELREVDTKIIRLAKDIKAKVITNDYNLNKIAQLEGITVLNINDLSNALKAVILPGEEISTQIIKAGKEPEQGVAYLDDGTMIVIEDGNRYVGRKVNVLVTSILQTPAGRMIFGKIKRMINDKSNKFKNTVRLSSGK